MTITTKKRTQLKSYFVKNAIPTEGNFADLVDAQLNQADDGVFKLAGEPLSVVSAAGDQKRVLRLYSEYPAPNADWLISLKPAQNPADPATTKPGFGIADGAGNTRLFISPAGNVGIGTNNPADKLTLRDGDLRLEGGRYRRLKIISDKYWAGIELVARQDGEAGNPHIDFTHGELDAPNFGIRVYSPVNNTLTISSGDGVANLSVEGNVTISGSTSARKLAVNDATNSGVDRGLWLWGPSDSAHVIYSANPSGTSPNNKPAIKGYFDSNHRLRFRTATGQGFLFENNNETALVDIDADNGNLWTAGALYAGNSDMYFTRTDHDHSGIGNTTGYAAIENASNYGALMILGRQTAQGRIVKLYDYLEVNGTLQLNGGMKMTGGALVQHIGIGTQEHGATTWPYETIQMHPTTNLRIWYGTKQRVIFGNNGELTIQLDSGKWVFQSDGNLVKYRNNGQAVWASGQGW
jgi:hypothetical protein